MRKKKGEDNEQKADEKLRQIRSRMTEEGFKIESEAIDTYIDSAQLFIKNSQEDTDKIYDLLFKRDDISDFELLSKHPKVCSGYIHNKQARSKVIDLKP